MSYKDEANYIEMNLHSETIEKLYNKKIVVYRSQSKNGSDTKYWCFKFPDYQFDITTIKEISHSSDIYVNRFPSGDIQVSWFADRLEHYKTESVKEIFNDIIDLVPTQMSWVKLLSPIKSKKNNIDTEYARSSFEHDQLRIVSSLSFRKLQNKTQVIPLCDNDSVHNRLTHSIEVFVVGKKLARRAAEYIWETHIDESDVKQLSNVFQCGNNHNTTREVFINSIGDVVAAACLIHDIGNPPFGHQGEEALNETFEKLISSPEYANTLGKLATLHPDLFKIEGNAQTIRLLNQNKNIDLTYATLAASIKYPRAIDAEKSIYKKFNIYESERELFNNILKSCCLNHLKNNDYERHPLVFLVEAADDICYSLFDFEDFVNLEFISEDVYKNALLDIIFANIKTPMAMRTNGTTLAEKRENYINTLNNLSFSNISSKLRSEALFQMLLNALHAFKEKYEYIITGTYTQENNLLNSRGRINGLLDIYANIMSNHSIKDRFAESNLDIRKHSIKSGYNNMAVLKNSLGGYEIMSELLKICIYALHNLNKLQAQMIILSIPDNFILAEISEAVNKRDTISWQGILSPKQQCEQIRLLNDYLTGLTDNEALKLFKHIKGHEQLSIM